MLNQFKGVNAVSHRLWNLFKTHGVTNAFYTPNGVDADLFTPAGNYPPEFCVGYSGSSAHDWRKGITEFIIPSAKKANVKVQLAMKDSDNYVDIREMPSFYRGLSCYVCASSSEGFSLSVLEACACGIPLITTRVGGMSELVCDGVNAFLVDRDIDAIVDKIIMLRDDKKLCSLIGHNMRKDIEKNWAWKERAHDWINFIIS
jgi:hypothetical protein